MKKSRIIFLVTMLLVVASTCTIWGAASPIKENKRGATYNKYLYGDKTIFCAVGTSSQAYTTIYNSSTTSYQVNAYVYEYSYATMDYSATNCNGGYISQGNTVNSGSISRNMGSYVVKYGHTATCTLSPYQPQQFDSYEYIANQYYE